MAETSLPKIIRHENGILQRYSIRQGKLLWGFDAYIGDHRRRKGGYPTRQAAETALSVMRLKAKQEEFGLSSDEVVESENHLWAEVETIVGTKMGAIGAACELLVSADLLRRGLDVYRAVASNSESDLIVVRGRSCARIEVKSAVIDKNGRTRWKRHRYDKRKHEILALVFLRDFRIEYRPDLTWLFSRLDDPEPPVTP